MDTPFEREVEPRLWALESVAQGRAFVRWYVGLSRAQPFGGFGLRFGADLDLEGIGAMIGKRPGASQPDDREAYRYLLDAVAELVREGVLRLGPRSPFDAFRASGYSVTIVGEAWLAGSEI